MEEKKLYELNQSQEIVKLQCKYTLFKRVINIITSIKFEKEINVDVMRKTLNKVIERNDCLRIKFVKSKGKLMQYFDDYVEQDFGKVVEFKTEEEFNEFILKIRKNPIAYKKGVVFTPYLCKAPDGRFMIVFKICHLIADMYGMAMIYNDISDVYDALLNGTELPKTPGKFEDVVKNDIANKHNDEKVKNDEKFFTELLSAKDEPFYAGLHGEDQEVWQKQLAKNKRKMKMYFIHNDTEGFMYDIDKKVVDGLMKYCEENKISPANALLYCFSLTSAILNGKIENMLPLELCNCRGTLTEKKCAGTKVQSIACYTSFDYEKSFEENLKSFVANQNQLYRHIGYEDTKFEMLLHKIFKSSMLETYYPFSFSFLPIKSPKDMVTNVYSNGKCALIAYIALMYDVDKGNISALYDVQTKLISKESLDRYHKTLVDVIKQVTKNPQIILNDIKK